jgi:hypothetical protein
MSAFPFSISRLTIYIPLLLLLCLFAQTMGHAHSASITFDEGPHLAVGYTTLRTGDLRLQPVHIHPPLANMMAAAPLLLQTDIVDPRSVGGWEIASLSAVTDTLIWQYPHPRRLGMASRFPIIGMTLLLGALVFRWASDHLGPGAGLVALCLCAFDPNIIAHGSLVTTDMPVVLWGTTALFLTARYLRRTRAGYLAGVGTTLGLALASKVSAISLLPPIAFLLLFGPSSQSWRRRFVALAGCVALAGVTLWAAYGFELRPLPGLPVPVPAATHLEIYRSLQEHYELGHPSFLMGRNSSQGWWTYFPVAFLLKTPLPTLILMVLSVLSLLRTVGKSLPSFVHLSFPTLFPSSAIRRWGPLVLFPLLYALSTPFSSVNIGYRHLLPILPFLFILIAPTVDRGLRIAGPMSRLPALGVRSAIYALLAGYLVGTLRMFPDYLAYFNLLAGGPEGGYRYLVDSNLDWGQNMWQLREWMQENGVDRVFYAHFSPDRPQVYAVRADYLPPDPRAVPFAPFDPAPGVYAIGATVLQGAYTPDVNTYAWFRTHEPLARLGHALFVYDVPPRPAPSWAAIYAAPTPVLSPEAVREEFGHPDMRVILLDCGQSWVFPTGETPGGYVLPPEGDPPPGAELEVAARLPSGNPSFSMYRLEDAAPHPERPIATIELDGPLAFLGHGLDTSAVHLGETVLVRTFWEVREPPGRPFSLMAHLVEVSGAVIAVGDGLGVGVDQLQPGDVIVQRHRLPLPEGTAAGEYELRTGAYWLDGTERWMVQPDGGTTIDFIRLESVAVLD